MQISNSLARCSTRSRGYLELSIAFQIRSRMVSLSQVEARESRRKNSTMIFSGGVVNRSATVRVLEVDNTTEQSILNIEQYFRGVESGVLYVDTYINGSLPHPEGNLSVTVNNNNVKYIKRSPGLSTILLTL